MKPLTLCAIILMTTSALAQTAALTDPKQLQSKQIENMQSFSIERLYMTRNIGSSSWSPDGKQIAFISNISGRNNLWLVPSTGGWPQQLTVSNQRRSNPSGRPTANGSPTPPTMTATKCGTSTSSRPSPEKIST
jgi:hypothetical protein